MSKVATKNHPNLRLVGVSFVALGASVAPAAAQTTSTEAPVAAQTQAQPDDTVPDIIVTAQRRSQSLQRAPVAVTALSPEVLESRNISTTQDLMQVTPGLQVSTQSGGNGSGSATFFLRGMGQQRAANGSEPAVGIYVDDIYYPSLQGTVFNIVDLAQVEVLRGPQGTLFGRNTIGGAIRYTTAGPSELFEGSLAGTYGSYDRRDVQGYVNLPLGKVAALRITAGHLQRDGFIKRQDGTPDAAASETNLVRGQLRIQPTSQLKIDLSAQYAKDTLEGFAYRTLGPIVPLPGTFPFQYNQSPAGILNRYDDRYSSKCKFCQYGPNFREFNVNRVANASGVVSWDLNDDITVKSLTGWTRVSSRSAVDLDASPLEIVSQNQSTFQRALSQEVQLGGKLLDGRLNFVAGLYYYREKLILARGLARESIFLGAAAPVTPTTRDTTSKAAYADINFALTDKLTAIGGIRFSRDDKDARANTMSGALVSSASTRFSSTTGRIGLQYQWQPNLMTYATISDGFRAGGFNYVASVRTFFPFKPEKLRSYEVGARADLIDGHLRFNPTFFYTDWSNIQLQSIQVTSTANVVRLDNAGKAHTYGLELESQLVLSRHFQIFGNLSTLHAEYTDIGAATGITLNSKFQRAPKLTYAIGSTYTRTLTEGWDLTGTVNYGWQGSQNSTPTDSDTLVLPSYGVLGARIEVTTPIKGVSVAVFGTNLTNELYGIGGVRFSKNVGADRLEVGRPREFGVWVRAGF